MSGTKKAAVSWGLILLLGCAVADPAPTSNPKQASQVKRWNGGKVQAPVEVRSSVSGQVTRDDPFPVTLTLVPQTGCRQLTFGVRGLGGVEVTGVASRTATPCAAGVALSSTVQVRVPPEVSGTLVVDVSVVVEGGRTVSSSRSFPLSRTGASGKSALTEPIIYDSNGNPVHLLQAH
jgi:hypothetical protein